MVSPLMVKHCGAGAMPWQSDHRERSRPTERGQLKSIKTAHAREAARTPGDMPDREERARPDPPAPREPNSKSDPSHDDAGAADQEQERRGLDRACRVSRRKLRGDLWFQDRERGERVGREGASGLA